MLDWARCRSRPDATLEALLEQAAVGIGRTTTEGRWIGVNQRLCDIVGYTREELLGRRFQDITHPDDLEVALARRRQLLANEIQTSTREKRYLRKDGSTVWIDLAVSVVRARRAPESFLAVIHDISERKRLAETLGEFNDMLMVISGRTQLGIEQLAPADPLRGDLTLVHATAIRAALLARELLAAAARRPSGRASWT